MLNIASLLSFPLSKYCQSNSLAGSLKVTCCFPCNKIFITMMMMLLFSDQTLCSKNFTPTIESCQHTFLALHCCTMLIYWPVVTSFLFGLQISISSADHSLSYTPLHLRIHSKTAYIGSRCL